MWKYVDDDTCANEEIGPKGLVELPPMSIPANEHVLESDDSLKSLLTKDRQDGDDAKALNSWLSTRL